MITKKKGLYLGLLVSLLGIGNVMQAYKLTIKNNTPYTVKFKVSYHAPSIIACRSDEKELGSGHTASINSGLCTVKKVEAEVYEAPAGFMDPTLARRQTRVVKAKPYRARWGRAGNTSWIISGPSGVGDKPEYIVTREVR